VGQTTMVILLALSLSAAAQQTPSAPGVPQQAKAAVIDHDTPLQLADGTYHFVTRTQRIERTGEETTEWWELRDASGAVILRRNYAIAINAHGFEETELVEAHAFSTKLGSGVLVEGMSLPSAPGSGSWLQVFGFKWGSTKITTLTPFSSPISIEGEFIDVATDPNRQAPQTARGTITVLNDVLRFRLWTGNFSIVYPVLINWITGKLEPSWHCLRLTSHGQIDRCDYPLLQATPLSLEERSFVRLFAEPDRDLVPSHIVVEPRSKIELLSAEVPVRWSQDADNTSFGAAPEGDIWLKVRIDGHEGWIHTQEDFQAIGLPQAG